jgi:hypothetical protein
MSMSESISSFWPQGYNNKSAQIMCKEPYFWVWGGVCKVENVCISVKACALIVYILN